MRSFIIEILESWRTPTGIKRIMKKKNIKKELAELKNEIARELKRSYAITNDTTTNKRMIFMDDPEEVAERIVDQSFTRFLVMLGFEDLAQQTLEGSKE